MDWFSGNYEENKSNINFKILNIPFTKFLLCYKAIKIDNQQSLNLVSFRLLPYKLYQISTQSASVAIVVEFIWQQDETY